MVCCSIITVLPNLLPLCVKHETQEIKAGARLLFPPSPGMLASSELAVFSVLRSCGLRGHDTAQSAQSAQGTGVALSYKAEIESPGYLIGIKPGLTTSMGDFSKFNIWMIDKVFGDKSIVVCSMSDKTCLVYFQKTEMAI